MYGSEDSIRFIEEVNDLINNNKNTTNTYCLTNIIHDRIYKFIIHNNIKGTPELYNSMKTNFPIDKQSYANKMYDYANDFIQQSHSVSKDGYAINQSYQFLQYVITDYDNHLRLETGGTRQYVDLGLIDDYFPSEYVFPQNTIEFIDSI